jgi:predicted transcriptional regulator
MAKTLESIRIDPSQKDILALRKAESGMGTSEYIRFLIEKDNLGRYKIPKTERLDRWNENRSVIMLSDSQITLLDAIKKEYTSKQSTQKPKDLATLCQKYNLDKKICKSDLNILVKRGILNKCSKDASSEYMWTNEGIFILPEYAFKSPIACLILDGNIASLMETMFNSYWETVSFIQDSLKLSKKKANDVFKIVLGEHVLFFKWLREHAFDMTGIPNPTDVIYYRKQMMNFFMSYCLMVVEPDFVETDSEHRSFCIDLTRRLSNYFKNIIK